MFAYCRNNPINYVDFSGNVPWLVVAIVALCVLTGAILGATSDTKLAEVIQPEKKTTQKTPLPPPSSATSTQSDSGSPIRSNTKDAIWDLKKGSRIPLPQDKPIEVIEDTSDELTSKDRISNTIIGASLGFLTAGGIVIFGGVAVTVITGSATTTISFLGMSGLQMVAWGSLSYNVFPIFVAPFLGIEMEPVELEP